MGEGGPIRVYRNTFPRNVKKHLTWRSEYLSGETMSEIATKWGVTPQAVQSVLWHKFGLGYKDSPRRLSIFDRINNRKKMIEKLERKCLSNYGCSVERKIEIESSFPGALSAYKNQKSSAKRRKIKWGISLPQWVNVWKESGFWKNRGAGTGYCMARWGDSGPYEVWNIYICTIGQNFSDSYLVHTSRERMAKRMGRK